MSSSPGSGQSLDVDAVRAVLDESPVSLAVLYGSHARGEATAQSDVDIAVVFDESLDVVARTRARLSLVERVSAALGTDAVDIVPLPEAPPGLRREVCADGIVLVGAPDHLDSYCEEGTDRRSRRERLDEFDELLGDLERVV